MARKPKKPMMVMSPTPARRVFAAAVIGGMGLMLIWLGMAQAGVPLAWRFVLIAIGATSVAVSWISWQITAQGIELREEGLFDTAGDEIAALDNIASVDRGLFAFKPSNGFLIRLTASRPRGWKPGLWWRVGRRVGIGGTTPGASGRAMADALTAMLAERDAK